MNFLKQTAAVTLLNLRTIPQRLGSSGVAIIGIAGVVIVLVSVLSIAQGFAAAMEASGSSVRAEEPCPVQNENPSDAKSGSRRSSPHEPLTVGP